jgi:hypothetical protein
LAKGSKPEPIVGRFDQETLAEMIGSTRSRVSHFMNKFPDLGYIRYNDGNVEVHSGLLSVLLNDKPHIRGDDSIDLSEPMSLALSRGKQGSWQV